MSQVRVVKTGNYTVMSNDSLKDPTLSNKARGLLCTMLSLPEEWNYTIKGLTKICPKDGYDSISRQLTELERSGYLIRGQDRTKGKFSSTKFMVFEVPWWNLSPEDKEKLRLPVTGKELTHNPILKKPFTDLPLTEKPITDNPITENPKQLNKDISNINKSITYSINYPSINLDVMDRTDIEERIKDNIDFDIIRCDIDENRLQGIVDIMTDMVCTTSETIRINREDIPSVNVAKRILSLDSEHIRYAVDCMDSSPVGARNQRAYIQSVLYNAPTVMSNDIEMLYHRTYEKEKSS